MSTRSRKRGSTRPNSGQSTPVATNAGASSAYVPTQLATASKRTGAGNAVILLGAILGVALILWGALALFAPNVLPAALRPQLTGAAPSQTEYHPEGRIAFVRTTPDGKRNLFVVNPDGSNQQQITQDLVVGGATEWSPDGRYLVAQAELEGISRVVRFAVGPDNRATDSVQLTADIEADSVLPTVSPDGSMIAFQSKKDGGDYQVFVMDINGNNKRRLSDGNGYAGQPAWSPDGKSIAYVSGEKGDPAVTKELYVVSVDGGAPRKLTSEDKDLGRPVWSPDGKLILYQENQGDNVALLIMDTDGGEPRTLASSGRNRSPHFSPDGTLITYYSVVPTGGTDVFVVPVSGGEPTNITPQTPEDYGPAWSPDGKKLVWASFDGSEWQIAIADADGSNRKVVSSGQGDAYQPVWGAPVK